MQYYTFEIVIEKEVGDEGYSAYSPTLPGSFSNGQTVEEAKQNIRDAIEQHLQSLLAHGQGFIKGQVQLKVVARLADCRSHRAPHRRNERASERRTRTSCLPVRGPLGIAPFST